MPSEDEDAAPERDRAFDLHLTAGTPRLIALIDTVEALIGRGSRKAAPHREALTLAVANLANAALTDAPPLFVALARPQGKAAPSRYRPHPPRLLKDKLQALHAAGLAVLTISRQRHRASTIAPTPLLRGMVDAAGITLADFRREGVEVIRLSMSTHHYDGGGEEHRRQPVEYADTSETKALRADMAAVNVHLADADLAFLGTEPVDVGRRQLYRVFNVPEERAGADFSRGGRLFGGWWQPLKRTERTAIRIAGRPVAELDFRALFLRLAYLELGLEPPAAADLYAGILDGDLPPDASADNRKRRRDATKVIVNAFLFAPGRKRGIPKDIPRADLPAGLTKAKDARAAILATHPRLAPALESGLGFRLMRTESDLLVAILLRLNARGITALPMHDGIIVADHHALAAVAAMGDLSEERLGFRLPVERKE